MNNQGIQECIAGMNDFIATNQTKNVHFRITALKKLRQAIIEKQSLIQASLWSDLHKSSEEAYLTEIGIVLSEIDYHIKHLQKWAKPKRVATPLFLFPSSSKIIAEPLGIALIIAPWNYPFQLMINPLIGAISAGCCAVLKPSPYAAQTAQVVAKMVAELFEPNYIAVFQGGREVNEILLAQKYDVIFFTGGPELGKIVAHSAAENLTPTVLELGGKSPCIVDSRANLDVAAKRIVWGKFQNSGQICIAPDYIFAHKSIKDELLKRIAMQITKMYGDKPQQSPFYARIINKQSFERLIQLIEKQNVYCGGEHDLNDLYIEPTVLNNVNPSSEVMKQEIFGPILPVMNFDCIDEVITYVNNKNKPLALYYFGDNNTAKEVLNKTSSGGACVNDVLVHIANHNLPFGGVGNSGMGKYHGKKSFEVFSNKKAVVTTPTWCDLPFKYVPFKCFNIVKRIL